MYDFEQYFKYRQKIICPLQIAAENLSASQTNDELPTTYFLVHLCTIFGYRIFSENAT